MVKRKYIIGLCFLIFFTFSTLANPWIPEIGKYNASASFITADKKSVKRRNQRAELFTRIQDNIYLASLAISEIYRQVDDRAQDGGSSELFNSEKRAIETLEQRKNILEQSAAELSSFDDNNAAYLDIEYGVLEGHSVGLKIGYKTRKFVRQNNLEHHGRYGNLYQNKTMRGKDLDVFYKYALFKNNNYIVTLSPKFHCSIEEKNKSWQFIETNVNVGYSKTSKKKNTKFYTFGLGVRRYINKNISNNFSYVLYLQEGYKYKNGFMINNYSEYEKAKYNSFIYRSTLYNQISVAKEFKFDSFKPIKFTTQLGYFWKSSVINKTFVTSGPIFSIWCNL